MSVMVGKKLRNIPGIHPQTEWTFVQAPIGFIGGLLAVWDERSRRGIFYLSRQHFQVVHNENSWDDLYRFCGDYFNHSHGGVVFFSNYFASIPGRAQRDLDEFDKFLQRAAGNQKMMDVAYVIVSIFNRYYSEASAEAQSLFVQAVEAA